MEPDILFSEQNGLGQVLLNRPKALNALTLEMCHALEARLRAWATDDGHRRGGGARRGRAGLLRRGRYPPALGGGGRPAMTMPIASGMTNTG